MTNEEKDGTLIRALVRKAGGEVTLTARDLEQARWGDLSVTNSPVNGDWELKA